MSKFFAGMSRRGRLVARNESASAAVEFALIYPIFIAIVLATLQAASIFLVKAFFETAAEEAARVVLTNQTETLTGGAIPDRGVQPADGALQLLAGDRRARAAAGRHDQSELAVAAVQRQRNPRQHAEPSTSAPSAGALRHGHAVGGDVSVAGLRRPARPQFRQSGQRPNAVGVDPGVPESSRCDGADSPATSFRRSARAASPTPRAWRRWRWR